MQSDASADIHTYVGIRIHAEGSGPSETTIGLEDGKTYRHSIEVYAGMFLHREEPVVVESIAQCSVIVHCQNDTQLVSILFRTHKSLSTAAKVPSLYTFDALSRAARNQVNKQGLTGDINSEQGNCATFLLKVEGVLDSLFQDLVSSGTAELKVSLCFMALTYYIAPLDWCSATVSIVCRYLILDSAPKHLRVLCPLGCLGSF